MLCTSIRIALRTVIAAIAIAAATVASSQQYSGAIFTSLGDGTAVNANLYDTKPTVFLNGGPQNRHAAGLPDGTYYFQVTNPNGVDLLSTDAVACRQLSVTNGAVNGATGPACKHADGLFNNANGSKPVQMIPFLDTTNNGGEYKAWLVSQDPGIGCGPGVVYPASDGIGLVFPSNCAKTDNFKVRKPLDASIVACKFNDLNGNGRQDDGEPTIASWPITATGVVDSNGVPGSTVSTVTGADGCVAFTVPAASNAQVTVTEGKLDANWYQTAPADGTYGSTTNPPVYTVIGGVVSSVLNGGQILDIDFGNRQALRVSKTAVPSYKINWTIAKTVDNSQIKSSNASAIFNYTVSVSHDSGSDWKVTGSVTLHNDSPDAITGVNVGDAVDNGATSCVVTGGTGVTVPANSNVSVAYVCSYSSLPPAGMNTATATWGIDGTASGTAAIDFAGTVPADAIVAVNDTLGGYLGDVSYTDASPKAFTYPITVTGTAGTCVTKDNTATFTSKSSSTTGSAGKSVALCVGKDLSVAKTATPSFTRTYTWAISKDVDKTYVAQSGDTTTFNYSVNASQTGVADSGWQVTGTITVSNPNDWQDISVNVSDAIDNGGTCTVVGGSNLLVPMGASATATYTCSYASAPSVSAFTNTANATWNASASYTPTGTASGAASAAFTTPTTTIDPVITVSDTFNSVTTTLGTLTGANTAPFTTQTFTYPRSVTTAPGTCITVANTARFTSNTTTTTGSAGRSVQLCVGKDLTVAKTATPAFTRLYNWAITKVVDKTQVTQMGGTATFNYTVSANQTGLVDSNWGVNGTITVTNPNNWQDVTVDVADAIDNGGSCVVSGGSSLLVPMSSSATATYTCTYAAAPSASAFTNSATATWNAAASFTPTGTASGTAGGAFSTPTATVNPTITVNDTFNAVTTTLGTLAATNAAPFASAAYNYARTVNMPAIDCVQYANTAMIVETGATSGQVVEVCGPEFLGSRTIGFWQNKNGQKIITDGSATAGVCNSGTWLRQFAPYQDLSATASCSAVATYAFNIIKAASSAGIAMNPMLKAQMLATAFDVYFSDAALGGNKIGALVPIGGATVDLEIMCADAGSCSSFENVSAAFGGATSSTILNMLIYAASQSNIGGVLWYGQVKSMQELAKDAFDAINNDKVFAP